MQLHRICKPLCILPMIQIPIPPSISLISHVLVSVNRGDICLMWATPICLPPSHVFIPYDLLRTYASKIDSNLKIFACRRKPTTYCIDFSKHKICCIKHDDTTMPYVKSGLCPTRTNFSLVFLKTLNFLVTLMRFFLEISISKLMDAFIGSCLR